MKELTTLTPERIPTIITKKWHWQKTLAWHHYIYQRIDTNTTISIFPNPKKLGECEVEVTWLTRDIGYSKWTEREVATLDMISITKAIKFLQQRLSKHIEETEPYPSHQNQKSLRALFRVVN